MDSIIEKMMNNNESFSPKIKIVGVGGGGSNAVNQIHNSGEVKDKSQFIVMNTDNQALESSPVINKLVLGPISTKGLGAGSDWEIGKKAAEESEEDIKNTLRGADLVFLTVGMGGGTGSGASPKIAKIAKDLGALVIGVVTTPFEFEGPKRNQTAVEKLQEFKKEADSIIVVSNNRLAIELGGVSFSKAFEYADLILKQAIVSITDIISTTSIINLDFADVKTVLKGAGLALIGTAEAEGDEASIDATLKAINSPILESSIEGADKAIVMISGSEKSLSIEKTNEAIQTIKEASGRGSQLDVIFGVKIDEFLGDKISVSVIATGLKNLKNYDEITDKLKRMEQWNLTEEINIESFKEISDELDTLKKVDEEGIWKSLNLIEGEEK